MHRQNISNRFDDAEPADFMNFCHRFDDVRYSIERPTDVMSRQSFDNKFDDAELSAEYITKGT